VSLSLAWAVESRVYAEDPLRNFLPSIGRLATYKEPVSDDGSIRVDTGVVEGSDISVYYDPLIAKLVTYGPNREAAIKKMSYALDSYVIKGVTHNVCFLREVMRNNRFLSGDISTKFIPEEFPHGFKGHVLNTVEQHALIVIAAAVHGIRQIRDQSHLNGGNLLDAKMFEHNYWIKLGEEAVNVSVAPQDSSSPKKHIVTINGDSTVVDLSSWKIESPIISTDIKGAPYIIQLFKIEDIGYTLQYCGTLYKVSVLTADEGTKWEWMPIPAQVDKSNILVSPMAGTLKSVAVKVGDSFHLGQELAIVEAMKMQNVLRAERDGKVKTITAKVDAPVSLDQVILEFEPITKH